MNGFLADVNPAAGRVDVIIKEGNARNVLKDGYYLSIQNIHHRHAALTSCSKLAGILPQLARSEGSISCSEMEPASNMPRQ